MEDNLKFLNEELEQLKKKIAKEREEGNFGTYKNLIQAFRNVLDLVNEEENKLNEWKQMYSVYTNVHLDKKQISVWEQNSKNEIRNRRLFNIEKEIIDTKGIKLKDVIDDSVKKMLDELGIDSNICNKSISGALVDIASRIKFINNFVNRKGDLYDIVADISDKIKENKSYDYYIICEYLVLFKFVTNHISEIVNNKLGNDVKICFPNNSTIKIEYCGNEYNINILKPKEDSIKGRKLSTYIYFDNVESENINENIIDMILICNPKEIYNYSI